MYNVLSTFIIPLQITKVGFVVILWMIIGRFKRVDVQVVQDKQETTYNIFKKLLFFKYYTRVLVGVTILFIVPIALQQYI